MKVLSEWEYLTLRRVVSPYNLSAFRYPKPVLVSVLTQKIVENVKVRYHEYVKRLDDIAEFWKREGRIPEWLKLTPMLRVKLLMKALGYTKSEIKKFSNDPDTIDDDELRRLMWRAIFKDFVYSPIAVRFQHVKGRLGEDSLRSWLESEGVDFRTEEELRKEGMSKTPDFLLENGWIESKAMFGDPKTHSMYWKRQYRKYVEMFGRGRVVYWFGHVRGLVLAETPKIPNPFERMVVYFDENGKELGHGKKLLKNVMNMLDDFMKGKRIVVSDKRVLEIFDRLGFEIKADDEPSDF